MITILSNNSTSSDSESELSKQGRPGDELALFTSPIWAVRWVTTLVSLLIATPVMLSGNRTAVAWSAVVLLNTVLRSIRPIRYTDSTRSLLVLLFEVGLHSLAIISTGFWNSPFSLMLINSAIVAGFARSFSFATRISLVATLAVSLPALSIGQWSMQGLYNAATWSTLLLLSGAVAGYSRHLSGEATRRHSLALDRVNHLANANELLAELHRVAQTLPASLDQGDVLDSSFTRLRSLVPTSSAMIVLSDGRTSWKMARSTANLASFDFGDEAIPFEPAQAIRTNRPRRVGASGSVASNAFAGGVRVASEFVGGVRGASNRTTRFDDPTGMRQMFTPNARSAIYVPLTARGQVLGFLGVESDEPDGFTTRDKDLLAGFAEPVALSIDNARWFDRLRTVGAAEERNRIARDLHDRIGQSLAFLGFEVDGMIRRASEGHDPADGLVQLRGAIRDVVAEVRDTLSDLRTNVSDSSDFANTVSDFAGRVAERSKLQITVDCDSDHRLPILQEREMWRIAQEALVNAERHSEATEVHLRWRCDSTQALLEISDNGKGLPEPTNGSIGRPDSYGLTGMRERADSIGAALKFISTPGEGTKVRCQLIQK